MTLTEMLGKMEKPYRELAVSLMAEFLEYFLTAGVSDALDLLDGEEITEAACPTVSALIKERKANS